MLKFTPRRRLIGGLRLPAHKLSSTSQAIRRGLIPERLYVSTRQHRGEAAAAVVSVGQTVLRGQLLARSQSLQAADVHAPTSGRIIAIEQRETPLFDKVTLEECIVIETDGDDRPATELTASDPASERIDVLQQIAAGGIVGLGGAVYATAAKIGSDSARPVELLIINGAECEPYISCDDMLMREAPDEIVRGADLLRHIVGAPECVIAIERDKPQAIDAVTAVADQLACEGLRIAELPSIYPAGGERQLVEVLTGAEIPSGRYPGDEGFLCQNVGTAYATHRYFAHGEPLTSRIVTITGSAVAEPSNVEAMIGTPISDLIAACGGYSEDAVRLIHGGSMMGFALGSDELAITKGTNCIIAATAPELHLDTREWPCIRCGECSIVCPARLQPQDLLLAARASDLTGLEQLSLDECIECGCCDAVCPSHIPLTNTFRKAKPVLQQRTRQKAFSEASEDRYQSRETRREETQASSDERRAQLRQMLGQQELREQAIREAVERAQRRRSETSGNGD